MHDNYMWRKEAAGPEALGSCAVWLEKEASYRVWTFSSEPLFLSQQDFNYVCGLEETFTQEEHIVVKCVCDLLMGQNWKESESNFQRYITELQEQDNETSPVSGK